MSAIIQAIPQEYNGVTFRSRLEARWAVFFDALHLTWAYEPETYRLSRWYLPDFYIDDFKMLVEVKPYGHVPKKRVDLIVEAAEQLTTSGQCQLFVVLMGPPRLAVRHAARWRHGDRTFCFDSACEEEDVRFAVKRAQAWQFAPETRSLADHLLQAWGVKA